MVALQRGFQTQLFHLAPRLSLGVPRFSISSSNDYCEIKTGFYDGFNATKNVKFYSQSYFSEGYFSGLSRFEIPRSPITNEHENIKHLTE